MDRSLSWIVVESGDATDIAYALSVRRTESRSGRHGMPHARRKLAALAKLAPFTFCEVEEPVTKDRRS